MPLPTHARAPVPYAGSAPVRAAACACSCGAHSRGLPAREDAHGCDAHAHTRARTHSRAAIASIAIAVPPCSLTRWHSSCRHTAVSQARLGTCVSVPVLSEKTYCTIPISCTVALSRQRTAGARTLRYAGQSASLGLPKDGQKKESALSVPLRRTCHLRLTKRECGRGLGPKWDRP